MNLSLTLVWLLVCCASCIQATCLSTQFSCSNGNCISAGLRCDHNKDCSDNSDEVGCVCYYGDIRLTGVGSTSSKGNVEFCGYNEFSAICGNVWSSNDAKVVCKQLGYNRAIASTSALYGSATTPYVWTDVAGGCTGTEKTLASCPRYPYSVSCTGNYPAAVQCSCSSTNFKCTNGHCIDTYYRCDGSNDCGDNSDETSCSTSVTCLSTQFTCSNGRCISAGYQCDGVYDCSDHSDEVDCAPTIIFFSSTTNKAATGASGGGLLTCIICCTCWCVYCCKKKKRSPTRRATRQIPANANQYTGQGNVIIIQDPKGQTLPPMPKMAVYNPGYYLNVPQPEPYPAPPSYCAQPNPQVPPPTQYPPVPVQ